MSEAEAAEYTRGSYYEGRDFYHGTGAKAATGIVTDGVRLISDVVNSFGDGFYLAFNRVDAIDYANQNPRPTLLSVRVLVKNPKKFADSLEVEDFLDENDLPFDDLQSAELTRILKEQGFDAIEVGGDRILVIIFNKRQIAVFRSEEVSND